MSQTTYTLITDVWLSKKFKVEYNILRNIQNVQSIVLVVHMFYKFNPLPILGLFCFVLEVQSVDFCIHIYVLLGTIRSFKMSWLLKYTLLYDNVDFLIVRVYS